MFLNERIGGFQGARKNPATFQTVGQIGLTGSREPTTLNPGIGKFAFQLFAKKKQATDRGDEFFSVPGESAEGFEGRLVEVFSPRKQLGSYSEVERFRVEMG